ncbi:hypothetical protein [Neorhizobium petrolearium]|uniref:hypothetical protein n=1 Tax=Neorhizobium petrolearium TaxID=515361 RepID=UPI003F1666CB
MRPSITAAAQSTSGEANMRSFIALGLLTATSMASSALAQDSNSKYFEISNYYYVDSSGDFRRYQARGFYEQGPDDQRKKKDLVLLPALSVDLNEIKYISRAGRKYVPGSSNTELPRAIRIPIQRSLSLPSETQLPALGAAVSGAAGFDAFLPEPLLTRTRQPYIYPVVAHNPQISGLIFDAYQQVAPDMVKQAEFAAVIRKYYDARIIDVESVALSINIDNQPIRSIEFKGSLQTSSPALATIEITNPDEYQSNRIAEGNFDLSVSYRFLDRRTSFIRANLDASRIINAFLSRSQSLYTQSKQEGWQFLGIGSRRSSLRQIFNEEIRQTYTDHAVENTVIEMLDADDDMIKEFEDKVFPKKSLDEVIAAHRAAEADPNLKQELRDVHKKYADALVARSLDLETDAAGAAASLVAGDYIGFFAKGVRFGSEKATGHGEFRGVIEQSADVSSATNWLQAKSISVRRSITQSVTVAESGDVMPRLGVCGHQPWRLPGFSQTLMLLTCVEAEGPLARADLVPGMLITSIDNADPPQDSQQLHDLLATHEPGDKVSFTFIDPRNMLDTKNVTLTRGKPRRHN